MLRLLKNIRLCVCNKAYESKLAKIMSGLLLLSFRLLSPPVCIKLFPSPDLPTVFSLTLTCDSSFLPR